MNNPPIEPYKALQTLSDEFKIITEKRALQKQLICNPSLQTGVKYSILSQSVVSHDARSVFDNCAYYWHWSGDMGGVLHVLAPDLVAALSRLDEFLTALFAVTRITEVAIGDGKTLIRVAYVEGSWQQQ